MPGPYDLFISFHPSCAEPVHRLRRALEAMGVVCCVAEAGAECPPELAQAKIFLAWCVDAYFRSRACQQHLATAYLACSGAPEAASERILLINAQAGVKHIYPVLLRRFVVGSAPGLPGAPDVMALAGRLEARSAGLEGVLGDLGRLVQPEWREAFDRNGRPAPRFAGRERELWDIHAALHPAAAASAAGEARPAVVVSGAAGQGKSALAREYACRFGPAYPGGIFRLYAQEAKPAPSIADLAANPPLKVQLAALLRQLVPGIDPEPLDVPALSLALGRRLAESGQPFLWLVDGLPEGLNGPAWREWLAPETAGGLGRSLITSRSQRYDQKAVAIHLPPLDSGAALSLLRDDGMPPDETERAAVGWLLEALGRHGGAMATAGALAGLDCPARQGPFDALCRRLEANRRMAAEFVSKLPGEFPEGRETEVLALYLCAVQSLDEPARDLLRLALDLADAVLPLDFIADCFLLSGLPKDETKKSARFTIHISLTEPPPEPMTAESARGRAETAGAELERLALAERTAGGLKLRPGIARILGWIDPFPSRLGWLRAAVLRVLAGVVDRCVGEGRWYALEPLACHARSLLADLRHRQPDVGEEPADIARRVRLALGLADLELVHGDTRGALTGYRACGAYIARAMVAEPGNGARQRDFAVIQERIGDVQTLRGDLGGALDCFRKSLGIRAFLVGQDPPGGERREEILRLHNKIAGILTRQGDLGGTLYSCRAAHGIYEKRVAASPGDAACRFDLAASFERLAGLYLRAGDAAEARKALNAALPIYRALAEAQPDRLEYLCAPGAIHMMLGDLLRARADLEGALGQYRTALAIAEAVAAMAPESPEGARARALCHGSLAQVLAALEDSPGAVEHYRAYLALAEPLAARGGTDGVRGRDLAAACMKLGMELERLPDRTEALAQYEKARTLVEKQLARRPGDQTLRGDLVWLLEQIGRLAAAAPED